MGKRKIQGKSVMVRRDIGSNIVDLVSNLVVSGSIPAIEELVANSYDADAKNVELTYRPDEDFFSIRDDGVGMSAGGVEDFYRLGDSVKLDAPVSPGGRRRIGKFGVATILLNSLCERYDLITRQSGEEVRLSEQFGGTLSGDEEIKGVLVPTSESDGTEIVMRGLKFGEDDGFSLSQLRKSLPWDLPVLPDFSISVNGHNVPARSVNNATKFKFQRDGKHMGHIDVEIYYVGKSIHSSGIYVYVNGRSVGDPKARVNDLTHRSSLASNIVGLVRADGLEDAILFDRGRFRQDHLGVIELDSVLRLAISKVETQVRHERADTRFSSFIKKRPVFINNCKKTLVNMTDFSEVNDETVIEFGSLDPDEIGHYNPEANHIVLNEDHSIFGVSQNTIGLKYEQTILSGIVDAIAFTPKGERKSIAFAMNERQRLWRIINQGPEEKAVDRVEVHPLRVYSPVEIANTSGQSLNFVRGLIASGILPSRDDEIQGEDFLKVEKQLEGLLSIQDIYLNRGIAKASNLSAKMAHIDKVIDQSEGFERPFIYRLPTENSFGSHYLVESTCINPMIEFLSSSESDLRIEGTDPAIAFKGYGDEYMPIPKLTEDLEGFTTSDTVGLIQYASHHGISIDYVKPGRGKKYKFKDVVRALQIRRGNNEITDRFYLQE